LTIKEKGANHSDTRRYPEEGEGVMSRLFARNTGNVDRVIRVIVGALLVGNVFVGLKTVVGWIGLVLIITGLFGTCPVYSLLGINTRPLGEKVGLK
jgi:hypothetical protein